MTTTIGFLGFGEAAQAFAGDKHWAGHAYSYDRKTDDVASANQKHSEYQSLSVRGAQSAPALAENCNNIISLVTANQSFLAAQNIARHLNPGTLFLDMNSVSPETKKRTAQLIEASGGKYVDAAIMAPVLPARLNVPVAVSGSWNDDALRFLSEIGFQQIERVGDQVGAASATKMIRSVLIKGIEALTAECLIAANAAGVLNGVLKSLGPEWAERANYNFERMMVHGERRAAEMKEVCATLDSLGISPRMSEATCAIQQQIGESRIHPVPTHLEDKLKILQKPDN